MGDWLELYSWISEMEMWEKRWFSKMFFNKGSLVRVHVPTCSLWGDVAMRASTSKVSN